MKRIIITLLINLILTVVVSGQEQTQTQPLPKIAVLDMDCKITGITPEQSGKMLRIAAEKTNLFEVMDIYDIQYLSESKDIKIKDCYGKLCLIATGKTLEADKMITGSIDKMGSSLVLQIRVVNVNEGTIEHSVIKDYAFNPQNLQLIIETCLREVFDLEVSIAVKQALEFVHKVDAPLKTVHKSLLKLDGPRMGATLLMGENSDIFQSNRSLGGYNGFPLMFQFGYQFEKQYINEGNFQALFEFIPMVTGLDQGIFIPSLTIMNGLRDNRGGWEFAFGPTMSFVKKAKGFYDANNDWNLESSWTDSAVNPFTIEKRMDSRGNLDVSLGFVFAVGKSFKTGSLNIPVNLYVIPSRTGLRAGLSVGFNARKKEIYAR